MNEIKQTSLEEAAEEYRQGEVDTGCDYIDDSDGDSLYHSACLADAFIAGAKWMKERMIKDAVEGEIQMRYSGCLCAKTIRAINEDKFKFGDKVKLIIVKNEE